MRHNINGVQVSIRLHPKRNLYEARLTHAGQRKSFYAPSQQEAYRKAKSYLQGGADLRELAESEALAKSVGVFVALDVAPAYAAKANKNTKDKSIWALEQVIAFFGHFTPEQITLGQVQTAWNQLAAKYPNANTQRTLLIYVSRTFKLLARQGRIPYNFAEEIDRPDPTKSAAPPTIAEATEFLKAIAGDRLEPKLFLEYILALRDEEANHLQLSHLSADNVLKVPGTKTDNAPRVLTLPSCIADKLREFSKGKHKYFVETSRGKRYNSNPTRDFRILADRAGTAYHSNHAYRRAFATGLEELGCPPTIRLTIMGQSTKSAVQHLYVHPSQAIMLEWLEKWAFSTGYFETSRNGVRGVQSS